MKRFTSPAARQAFTIIELLVVISILGVLAALSAGVVFRVTSAQTTATSRTLITRLGSALQKQVTKVADEAKSTSPPSAAQALAGADPTNLDLARSKVIALKLHQKRRFPTTFAEALNPSPAMAFKPYTDYLNKLGIYSSNVASQPMAHQSAACLLMILRTGQDAVGEDDLGMAGSIKALGTPPVPCLVDAWGTPLVFCRWPTGDTNGISPANRFGWQNGYNDPADTQGQLNFPAWYTTGFGNNFQTQLHVLRPHQAGKPQSLKLVPTIMSAGSDRDGYDAATNTFNRQSVNPQTMAITNATTEPDNIYSIEQQ